jgi:DNA-binding transcriptional regulator YiaG
MPIKEVRLSACLTRKQMSDLLGVPLRTLEDWESGKRKPPEYVVSLIICKLAAEGYDVGGEKENDHRA